MRSYFFLVFFILLIPCSLAYADLPPITETPPALTLDVNETFPPSLSDGASASSGGAFGGGNVTGTVEDALNNETSVPSEVQEELDQAQEEQERLAEEQAAQRNPDKEGSAAVTVDENPFGISSLIPLLAGLVVIGILLLLVISGRKKRKATLPKKV